MTTFQQEISVQTETASASGSVFARAFGLSYGSKPRMNNAKLARGVVRL